jgi:pilus assembly protein FimV
MTLQSLRIALLACAGLVTSSQVLALGFGRIPDSIPFGQALDLSVPLRIDAGEPPAPACLQAEVHVGEQRLPPDGVLITLERGGEAGGAWQLRIRSAVMVQEPLVEVSVSVGCNGSVSRRFVVFADPPAAHVEVSRLALAEPPAAVPVEAVPRAPAGALPSPKKPVRKARADDRRARVQIRSGPPAVAARSPTVQRAAPRLKLEEPEELLKAARLTVAAQDAALASATQAAGAAQAAASAAQQRLVALESNLAVMREDAAAHRAAMDLMRTRLAQTEDQGHTQSVLVAAVAALGALVLWLAWRMRLLQRERQAAWWHGAAVTEEPAALPVEAVAMTERAGAVTAVLSAELETPSTALADDILTRPASVDDLIDLEQQAEFFTVLGDEDATVALLKSHLRSTGGASPMPNLKLLELYRRRGEREAHDRKRVNISQRFGAAAPEWEASANVGCGFEDYPVVLARLQACWNQPLEAMGELEDVLLHRRGGELFDLPAYRDALMLYSVARDLHRQAALQRSDVDVFLPLPVGDAVGSDTSPWHFDGLRPGSAGSDAVIEDRPTAPVDLDLSEAPAPQDSRIGELSSVRATLR